jgi:hypothetical protein
MESHGFEMKGPIRSSDGVDAITIETATGDVTVENDLQVDGAATVTGLTTLDGELVCNDAVELNEPVTINASTLISPTLFSIGTSIFQGTLRLNVGSPHDGYMLTSDSEGWVEWIRPSIPVNARILFETDVVIPGYELLKGHDDMLVYITKGDDEGVNKGGYVRGEWRTTIIEHNHKWYDYQSKSNTYSWLSNGSTQVKFDNSLSGKTTRGLMAEVTLSDSKNAAQDMWTQDTSGETQDSWRPRGISFTRQRRM